MEHHFFPSSSSAKGLWLDPRTKLYLLVVFSIVMIDGKTGDICSVLKPALALLPFLLLLLGGRGKAACVYMIVFAGSWVINLNVVPHLSGVATLIVALITQLGMRWFPSAMMGYYLLSTTKVNEFTVAMQKMRMPDAFIVPFSVMFRFFPTILEEAESIGNAMRMRGITGRNFFRNPAAMLEYRMVPLMMSVVTIGNDLSAAAITRGLGSGKKRSSVCRIGFRFFDGLFMLIATIALILFLVIAGGIG